MRNKTVLKSLRQRIKQHPDSLSPCSSYKQGDVVQLENGRLGVCLRVTFGKWFHGRINTHRPGLHIFYGAWYAPFDLSSIETFGKIEPIHPATVYPVLGNVLTNGSEFAINRFE